LIGASLVCAWSVSNCGFPDYAFNETTGGGSNAGGGVGGDAGTAGTAGNGGALGGSSGSSGSAGSSGSLGEAGMAGEAGGGGTPCTYPTPVTYPQSCFDNANSPGETGTDCGGSVCPACFTANQGCLVASDCANGECSAGFCTQTLRVSYMSLDANASTPFPKFRLVVEYLSQQSLPLKTIRLRYFFNHDGVSEPVLAQGDAQALLNSQDITSHVRWTAYRLPLGPADNRGRQTDSYLEITFSSAASLQSGSMLELVQSIAAGSANPPFQQAAHYSFEEVGTLTENRFVTLDSGTKRLWGVEPPLAVIPDCAFQAAVNFGGPAVTVGGYAYAASTDAAVDFAGAIFDGTGQPSPLPDTDNATTQLLSTSFVMVSNQATWPVANGSYWAYTWLTSALSTDAGQLTIQDNPADPFQGVQRASGAAWARMGPYPIDVLDGNVKFGMIGSGRVSLAGAALFKR